MVYMFDGYNYVIRLDKDERLSGGLQAFMDAEPNVTGAITAIGGAQEATLGFYDLETQEYQFKTFNSLFEIASLQGSVAFGPDSKLMFHAHGVLSGRDYQTIAGHVKDLVVGGTCEIFLHSSYKPLHRKQDPTVGLKVFDL